MHVDVQTGLLLFGELNKLLESKLLESKLLAFNEFEDEERRTARGRWLMRTLLIEGMAVFEVISLCKTELVVSIEAN